MTARRRRSASSGGGSDLLVRSPVLAESPRRSGRVIDLVDQLEELTGLFRRGLLSPDEFKRQKRKVLDS